MTAAAFRRAALLLHALPGPDREWLLDALPRDARAGLLQLLDELQAVGLAPEPGMIEGWLASARHPLHNLGRRQLGDLARMLAAEPPAVAARLLAADAWPWQDALLARLPAACAGRVRAALQLPRAPALEQAVLASVLRRLQAQAASPRKAWSRRVAARLRNAFRGLRGPA